MDETVQGFVLAAGFGQRMLPITESVPKPLLPIGRLPLIGYSLRLLAHHGITDVTVNLHHLGRAVRDALGDGSAYGVKLTYSQEDEILGTGGGIKRMYEHLDSTVVVLNSDTVLDLDLHAVLAEHRARRALATMVLRHDPEHAEGGRVGLDAASRIVEVPGYGENIKPSRRLMFTGVHVLEPRFLEYLPPNIHSCIIRYGYAKALQNNEYLYGTLMQGYWADAGTPGRYYALHCDALGQRLRLRHADPLAGYALTAKREVAEVVRMGEAVELGAETHLTPPVLLGDHVRLGDRSVIGPGVVLGDRVQVGREAQIADSVVMDGVKVEAGAHLRRVLVGKKGSLKLADELP